VGDPIRVAPGLLYPRRLDRLLSRLRGELPNARRCRGRKRLKVFGQPLLDHLRDVDVRVELVDGVGRDRIRDRLVLQQLVARAHPLVRVKGLTVHPAGEDRQEGEDRSEN
jgi:hypothetical protein